MSIYCLVYFFGTKAKKYYIIVISTRKKSFFVSSQHLLSNRPPFLYKLSNGKSTLPVTQTIIIMAGTNNGKGAI